MERRMAFSWKALQVSQDAPRNKAPHAGERDVVDKASPEDLTGFRGCRAKQSAARRRTRRCRQRISPKPVRSQDAHAVLSGSLCHLCVSLCPSVPAPRLPFTIWCVRRLRRQRLRPLQREAHHAFLAEAL